MTIAVLLVTSADTAPPGSLAAVVVSRPVPVLRNGHRFVAYELQLSPAANGAIASTVLVQDAATSRALAMFAAGDLQTRLAHRDPTSRQSSGACEPKRDRSCTLFIEFDLPDHEGMSGIVHRIGYDRRDGSSAFVAMSSITLGDEAPVVLAPPLRMGLWVAVHQPSWPRGHRRMVYSFEEQSRIPGRFAVDWVGVDHDGKISKGRPDCPSDAVGYGADVLAGAAATVVATRDGMPERRRIGERSAIAPGDEAGNYVTLRLGRARYAFYEHLKPGSVRVRPGDRVHAGQVLGSLGFSGESTGPHLHLHVADCGDPLRCEGVPFTITGMTQVGRYDDVSAIGHRLWQPDARTMSRPEWPDYDVVVTFATHPPSNGSRSSIRT